MTPKICICFYLNGANPAYGIAGCLTLHQLHGYDFAVVIIVDDNVPVAFLDIATMICPDLTIVQSGLSNLDRKRRFESLHFVPLDCTACFCLDIHDMFTEIASMKAEMEAFGESASSVMLRYHGRLGRVDAGNIGFRMPLRFEIYRELAIYETQCPRDFAFGCDERFLSALTNTFFHSHNAIEVNTHQWGRSQIDAYSIAQLCTKFCETFGAHRLAGMFQE